MKKVLITGADGFIGRNLVRKLLDEGKEVIAIVYPGNNVYEQIKCNRLCIKSIDLNQCMKHVKEFPEDVDVMYHLAWQGVAPEQREDFEVQISNISMSIECMKFAVALGIKKVIVPGSTSEYWLYGKPINKNAVPSPNNAYGAMKIALRYLCGDYLKKGNIEYVYVIVTGIYSEDRKDNNVIFYTIDKLLCGEKPVLTKLEQLWDYVHIRDVVDAFIAIGEKGKNGVVYAIGHGDNWPLRNYINIIHNKIDASIPLGIGEKAYNNDELPSSCIDLTELERDTGFRPKISFEEGISEVIDKIKRERKR